MWPQCSMFGTLWSCTLTFLVQKGVALDWTNVASDPDLCQIVLLSINFPRLIQLF